MIKEIISLNLFGPFLNYGAEEDKEKVEERGQEEDKSYKLNDKIGSLLALEYYNLASL